MATIFVGTHHNERGRVEGVVSSTLLKSIEGYELGLIRLMFDYNFLPKYHIPIMVIWEIVNIYLHVHY